MPKNYIKLILSLLRLTIVINKGNIKNSNVKESNESIAVQITIKIPCSFDKILTENNSRKNFGNKLNNIKVV